MRRFFVTLLVSGLILGLGQAQAATASAASVPAAGVSSLAAASATTLTAGSLTNTLTASVRPLTFQEALATAASGNRTYQITQKAETAASAAWWQAMLAFGPSANLQFQYVLENKPMVTVMDFGSAFSSMGSTPMEMEMATNYYSGRLSVSQPLFTGFKLVNGLELASLNYAQAKSARDEAASQLYVDVAEAYYSLLVAGEMARVMAEGLHQTEEHVAVVKAKYREGSVSNYDVLRSEVQAANLKPQLAKAQNLLRLSRKKLALTLGLDAEQSVDAVDVLAVSPAPMPDLSTLQAQALAQRWDLANMTRTVKMADIAHTLALKSNMPIVALAGTWTYYDTLDKDFPPEGGNLRHSWEVSLGLSWPLWDNLAVIPKAVEAAAKADQARLGEKAMNDGIRLEVEALYLTLQAAQDSLAAGRKTVEQAEKGYSIAVQQYAGGMMTNLDVMDAQLALNQAKMNLLQTQYECLLTQVKLRKAAGEALK